MKKYANRRLYDTEASRYITLEELASKIRQGADATVVDAASGEDLTQATLAQIILESRGAAQLLPVPLLVQLIRMGDDALAEFMGRFLSTALDLYLTAKQGALAMAPFNPFATAPFVATSALARMLLGGSGSPPATGFGAAGWSEPPPAPPAQREADEVKDLRREIEELKRAVRAVGTSGRSAGRKRPR